MKERVLFRGKKKVGSNPSYAAGVCLYVCVRVCLYIYRHLSRLYACFNGSSSKSVSLTLVDRAILDEIK